MQIIFGFILGGVVAGLLVGSTQMSLTRMRTYIISKQGGVPAMSRVRFVLFLILAKLPIMIGGAYLSTLLETNAFYAFLFGLTLVYFLMIGYVFLKARQAIKK